MIDELLEMLKELEENDEFFDTIARILKKSYNSLIKAGFTQEQATTIVAGQGSGVKTS